MNGDALKEQHARAIVKLHGEAKAGMFVRYLARAIDSYDQRVFADRQMIANPPYEWDHRRYFTDLGVGKMSFANAKRFAKAIFADPEKYRHFLGEGWYGLVLKDGGEAVK